MARDRATTDGDTERPGLFSALKLYESFRLLWIGTVATQLGQWMQNIALGWYMLDLTDSPFWVSMIAFSSGIPFLIVSLPAGALIDHADERKVLMASQWTAMVTSAALAALILTGWAEPWHLLVFAGINGTIMAVNQTVRQTIVPSVVAREHLSNAVSLNSAGANAMRIIGPSIAGVIIGAFGVAACFIVQAVALGGALVTSGRIKRITRERGMVAGRGIIDGFRELQRRPALGSLMVLTAVPAALVFPYIQLMPVFARDVFDIGAGGLGLLMVASGIGALSGALTAAGMDRVQRKGLAVMVMTTVYCVAVAGFAASPHPLLAMLGLFVAGFSGSIFGSLTSALMLLLADPGVRGRVMGIYLLTSGLTPFGAIAIGAAASSVGTPEAVAISCFASAVIVGIAATRMRDLRIA
jgi:MFS family permease